MVNLEKVPLWLKQKFDSESWFQFVNVATEDTLEISSDVDAVLAALTAKNGKTGAGILIGQPVPASPFPNAPGPDFRIAIPLSVFENPTINRDPKVPGTELTAVQIAFYVIAHLHRWQVEGLQMAVAPNADGQFWTKSEDFKAQGYQCIDLVLMAALPCEGLSQVVRPAIEEAALTITLTNVTAGAEIFYTIDGTFPGSGNAAAVKYNAPFAVPSGTEIYWAAYKPGCSGSDVGHATVS